MKTAHFNPDRGPLWIDLSVMKGYYSITYTCVLLDTDRRTPLTVPPFIGGDNQRTDRDDIHEVRNDLRPGEPIQAQDGRYVYVRFGILQVKDDFGYKVRVTIRQGQNKDTAVPLADYEERTGTVGADGAKDEVIEIKLSKS